MRLMKKKNHQGGFPTILQKLKETFPDFGKKCPLVKFLI